MTWATRPSSGAHVGDRPRILSGLQPCMGRSGASAYARQPSRPLRNRRMKTGRHRGRPVLPHQWPRAKLASGLFQRRSAAMPSPSALTKRHQAPRGQRQHHRPAGAAGAAVGQWLKRFRRAPEYPICRGIRGPKRGMRRLVGLSSRPSHNRRQPGRAAWFLEIRAALECKEARPCRGMRDR